MPIGPSTTHTPYIISSEPNVTFTSILTVGETVPGAITGFVGRTDGIGAFDNGNGTATVLVNHELGAGQGVVRAHGSAGAFVERLTINIATLQVISSQDAATSVFLDPDGDGVFVNQTTAWSAFCSGDLAPVSAFNTAAGNIGTAERIYLTGEEAGAEGRAFAFVLTGAEAGRAYELPRLGNMSFENAVANPSSAKTVVMLQDDSSALGQVYMYVGTRQSSGNVVERAGLTNGQLYGVRVTGMTDESDGTTFAGDQATFTMEAVPNAQSLTGAQIQAQSEATGISEFMRPEDGAWDPSHSNWYYFNSTATFGGNSRLWRLEFNDINNPSAGGIIRMMLRGPEGQKMLDNMTVAADGKVVLLEDPGNNAFLARVLIYDPATDQLEQLGIHDAARFLPGGASFKSQAEEASGVVDVTAIFGSATRQAFLLDNQAHNPLPSPLIEGGQLLMMTIDKPQNGDGGDNVINGGAGVDVLSGGAGNDTIRGGSNNDRLSGDGNDDVIDGGIGDDTAIFSQALASYLAKDLGSHITISGPDGNDTLTTIEHLQFADGKVDLNDGDPLFDTLFYDAANPDVFHAQIAARLHFQAIGWREGRDPNAFFDTSSYLSVNRDVAAAGISPLQHYHASGWREGRDPSPDFDTTLYLLHNPDVAAAGIDPLWHFLASGHAEGRVAYPAIGSISSGFDAQYYLWQNPDVAAAGVDPLWHFKVAGWHEGRNPNAWFDTAGYLAHYTDVAVAGINPLQHYLAAGWREGRDPSLAFDTRQYLAANPDVAAANIDPLQHFLKFGIYEGRTAVSDGTWFAS
jgi:serralysin